MFEKILVANRGEIAIRAFRAAYELGVRTVAVYTWEDRASLHRQKADEAYLIGERGHPIRAHLDIGEIIRVARLSGADAIYPGYGFLSESPELAQAAVDAGLTFIGPTPEVLERAGNKVTAKQHAIAAGVPVLASSPATTDMQTLLHAADEIGFPVFTKAVAGGGGRGMRRVETREELRPALESAMREAQAAFGDPSMFIEQAVLRPRHIEVQILADSGGETIHLYERDCSLQRRHQKVVEIAPAPNLDPAVREAILADGRSALMRCLDLGADEAVLLCDRKFAGADTWATALTLASAVKKVSPDFDLILTGKQAIDGDTAQVGPEVAEILGIPQITYAVDMEVASIGRRVRVRRESENGYEIVTARMPALVSVVKGEMLRRMPSFADIVAARGKPFRLVNADDLLLDESQLGLQGSYTRVVRVFPPCVRKSGRKVEGLEALDAAHAIIEFLRAEGFI
ncbi:MAG: hypothetical protein M0038_15825 [Pseudomonadota bacterium]|nr:hypothetical protein [Pseudomonadota bacterium]